MCTIAMCIYFSMWKTKLLRKLYKVSQQVLLFHLLFYRCCLQGDQLDPDPSLKEHADQSGSSYCLLYRLRMMRQSVTQTSGQKLATSESVIEVFHNLFFSLIIPDIHLNQDIQRQYYYIVCIPVNINLTCRQQVLTSGKPGQKTYPIGFPIRLYAGKLPTLIFICQGLICHSEEICCPVWC